MTRTTRNSLRFATAILATCTAVPFLAQSSGSAANAQVQTGASVNAGQQGAANGTESLYATGQPLQQSHEGFWGHLNPMARKKWVNRQVNPVKDRLNELDELTATNARQIKDVDARAQAGISKAQAAAQVADEHATAAGNTANQAQQLAQNASSETTKINDAVSNMDQYQSVNSVEIRFRNGQSVLGQNAKDALDQLVGNLQGQRGYLIDVQGYSTLRGNAGVSTSHRMASAVTRYLVTQHQIPIYKIHEIGLGNTPVNAEAASRHRGSIVEVTVMQNSLSTLSASNAGASTTGAAQSGNAQSSSNGTASQPMNNNQ
jgi:outer membrane protein OmpA-like peptidoglycan-associated protein